MVILGWQIHTPRTRERETAEDIYKQNMPGGNVTTKEGQKVQQGKRLQCHITILSLKIKEIT